jgi:hypothetical protein
VLTGPANAGRSMSTRAAVESTYQSATFEGGVSKNLS